MHFKKLFVIVIALFFIFNLFPNALQSKVNDVPQDSLKKILPPGTRTDTFDWTHDYIGKVQQMGVFDHDDPINPLYTVNRGDFVRWLIKTKNIELIETEPIFEDVSLEDRNYPYIMTAAAVGIVENKSRFFPNDKLIRADASIWIVQTHGSNARNRAKSIESPLIPAQDGFDAIPEKAIGSLTVCYLPDYQLMEYRYLEMDDFRYVQAEAPILLGETAYSLFMLAFPPVRGGKIVTEISMEPGTLFHRLDYSPSNLDVATMLYQSAISGYDPQWKTFPSLIKRIPTFENGLWVIHEDENGEFESMELIFELHQGLQWSDGNPLKADDFVFSHYFFNHPSFPGIQTEMIYWIDQVEAIDDYTIRALWNTPYLFANSIFPMPRHYFEEKFDYHLQSYFLNDPDYYVQPSPENPQGYESDRYLKDKAFIKQCTNDEPYNTRPIHAGPYTIKEWNRGKNMILEANEFYIYGPPLIQEIEMQFIPNSDKRVSKLIQGSIDLSLSSLTIDQAYEMGLIPDSPIKLYYSPSTIWEHIDLNLDDDVFSDLKVRQALIFGLNREKMTNELFDSHQPIAHSWLPSLHPAYDESSITTYDYDPTRANQLLDEAGWKINPETQIREKEGKQLIITFMTTAGSIQRELQQSIIAEDWKQLNIEVKFQNQFAGDFFNSTLRERKFDGPTATMYAWIMGIHSNLVSILHSDYIPSKENQFRGQNYTAYSNEQVDQLLEENLISLDKKTIYANLRTIQQIATDDLPSIPLFHRIDIKAAHHDIANYKPSALMYANTWNCAYWYWKKEDLPSHPSLIIESDDIDFGTVSVHDKPSSVLIISNYGSEEMKLRIEPPHIAIVLSHENLNLPPRGTITINVTLDPTKLTEYGPFAEVIRIFSNDPFRPQCGIIVKAYLMKPPSLEVGGITLKEPNTFSLSLKNIGEEDLEGKITCKTRFLKIEPSFFALENNASIDITLTLLPEYITKTGPLETELIIHSNDHVKPEVLIQFKTNYGIRIFLTIGEKKAFINQEEILLDVAPMIQQGRTLVPLRFIAEAFGATVEWEGELQRITIYFVR